MNDHCSKWRRRKMINKINVFSDEIAGLLESKYLDKTYGIEAREIIKNNSVSHFGIIIRDETNVAPTIYVDQLYEKYRNGEMDINECASEVFRVYDQHKAAGGPFEKAADMVKFPAAEKCILPKLINGERNKAMLKTVPHSDFGDLAVIYQIVLPSEDDEVQGAITVTNEIFKTWKISLKELHETSVRNLRNTNMTRIESMLSILVGRFGLNGSDGKSPDPMTGNSTPESMYVMSSENKINGAVTLLDSDCLEEFARVNGSFYIIPSSIHELILLPDKDGTLSFDSLKDMITDVNKTVLSPEEVLGYEPYYYDSERHTLYYGKKRKMMSLRFAS